MYDYGCMYGWMDVWMDGCMDGCMDAWVHACMHACMFVCMYVCQRSRGLAMAGFIMLLYQCWMWHSFNHVMTPCGLQTDVGEAHTTNRSLISWAAWETLGRSAEDG